MRVCLTFAASVFASQLALGLPNAILGALAQHDSPLNGEDLTETLLAAGLWEGSTALPGDWESDTGVANAEGAYLMARPKVFAVDALLVRALKRNNRLEELQITFADAGSYFGYLDQSLPKGLTREEAVRLLQTRLAEKQSEFSRLYRETLEKISGQLDEIDERPRESKRGRTRDLRAEYRVYRHEEAGLVIQLLDAPDRLLRVSIRRDDAEVRTWLDAGLEELSTTERLRTLSKNVTRNEVGDTIVEGVEVVPQGYRPYCGLNTLVMAARYLGLHLDEDWLAVAGKFQNTGSAAGSDMLGLYGSVAREARISLQRENAYDHATVRRSLQAGMPVIVWRRWDQGRDQQHTKVSQAVSRGETLRYQRPTAEGLPSKKKGSPVHASVIIGFNDDRQEIIFLESWGAKAFPRRMPVSEIDHTADYIFCFRP